MRQCFAMYQWLGQPHSCVTWKDQFDSDFTIKESLDFAGTQSWFCLPLETLYWAVPGGGFILMVDYFRHEEGTWLLSLMGVFGGVRFLRVEPDPLPHPQGKVHFVLLIKPSCPADLMVRCWRKRGGDLTTRRWMVYVTKQTMYPHGPPFNLCPHLKSPWVVLISISAVELSGACLWLFLPVGAAAPADTSDLLTLSLSLPAPPVLFCLSYPLLSSILSPTLFCLSLQILGKQILLFKNLKQNITAL